MSIHSKWNEWDMALGCHVPLVLYRKGYVTCVGAVTDFIPFTSLQ